MMNFRTIKASIIEILGDAADDCFRVVGYQRQGRSADESVESNRLVQVYYSEGKFPKSASRHTGPVSHDITFRIDLMVASASKGDLATLNSENATPAEKAAALESMATGGAGADESYDELFELVYQILMDARNVDMGQDIGVISSRWLNQQQKDQPLEAGNFVILTGSCFLTLRTSEDVIGITAIAAGDTQDVQIDIDGDDIERTGKIVNA